MSEAMLIMLRIQKWDLRFMLLAKFWANTCSKDPSTKVGAVIADKDMRIVSIGFNGFPIGVNDDPERYKHREMKYALVCHAEANAILSAKGRITEGDSIYCWPLAPCKECAKLIIQSGIKHVVAPKSKPNDRWEDSNKHAKLMYDEAGVSYYEYDLDSIEEFKENVGD